MKSMRCLWLCSILIRIAQAAAESVITERTAHFDTHQNIEAIIAGGSTNYVTNTWTLLQPGLNYFSETNRAWIPSSTEIDLAEVGAEFKRGPFRIKFPATHNAAPLEYTLPGQAAPLKIKTIGIALTDLASGDSIWLGEAQNANGFLDGNTVAYPDAFSGLRADIRITVSIGKVQSDVVLREQIVSPAALGWNPENARVEVFHQFISGPEGVAHASVIPRANGSSDPDEQIDFGDMFIGPGVAFLIGTNRVPVANTNGPVRVAKERFNDAETQTHFLIESIPYSEALQHLQTLPAPEEARVNRDTLREKLQNARSVATASSAKRRKPVSMAGIIENRHAKPTAERKVASITRGSFPNASGFVLDYTIVAGASNFRFKGDTTYYITNEVNLAGTTSIEGGTVVKFNSGTTPVLKIHGAVNCETGPYCPAIFTAKDDNTIGQNITGSNGSPSGEYGDFHLYFSSAYGSSLTIHDIRSRYGRKAIGFYGSAGHEAYNLQFMGNFANIVGNGNTITLRNLLSSKSSSVVLGAANNTTFKGEHFTVHKVGKVIDPDGKSNVTLALTNSLVVIATNSSSGLTTDTVTTLTSDVGVFQTVGAGAYYLADNSPYRDAGTTSISTNLLGAANLVLGIFNYATTYPPLWLTNNFAIDTVVLPQAQRDRDKPDLGYHYPALDWLVGGVTVSAGSTLLLTNGVALGLFNSTAITVGSGSQLISEGRPLQLNRMVRFNTVQEQTNIVGAAGSALTLSASDTTTRLRFTELSSVASGGGSLGILNEVSHSILWNISYSQSGVDNATSAAFLGLTNNLFLRCSLYFDQQIYEEVPGYFELDFENNLFRYGSLGFLFYGSQSWNVNNNLFDNVSLTATTVAPFGNYSNGYVNASELPSASSSISIASPGDYLAGVQGRYYYSTSGTKTFTLVNAGYQNASDRGLQHFTVRTDHTKDSGTVDIGYHVVAINGFGPIDTDGDGIPDYLEDRNGNGTSDLDESAWNYAINGVSGLSVFTPLKK